MNIPKELFYTRDHEWIKPAGKKAVMGITEFAQSQLGDITFIELPAVGKSVQKSHVIASVESVKAASDIFAPVSGVVTAVNNLLESNPGLINESVYEKGWIAELDTQNPQEYETLMDASAYEKYLKETSH